MTFAHTDGALISADEGLKRLIDGNRRFMEGKAHYSTFCKETLADLAREQHPYATILGCSDSRVPPELIFDADFGELFIIRVAGNVMSPEVKGSLQYAGSLLHTPLFVILGHQGCGAVQAALAYKYHRVEQRSHIQALVNDILRRSRNDLAILLDDPGSGIVQRASGTNTGILQEVRYLGPGAARKA
ncbi:MAG TPA: carbonic anhydrase [Terriglobales bacterium]|nr:carbonic anhydrase [Terriglobales bacterium]